MYLCFICLTLGDEEKFLLLEEQKNREYGRATTRYVPHSTISSFTSAIDYFTPTEVQALKGEAKWFQ
jgi:hypothetical protein